MEQTQLNGISQVQFTSNRPQMSVTEPTMYVAPPEIENGDEKSMDALKWIGAIAAAGVTISGIGYGLKTGKIQKFFKGGAKEVAQEVAQEAGQKGSKAAQNGVQQVANTAYDALVQNVDRVSFVKNEGNIFERLNFIKYCNESYSPSNRKIVELLQSRVKPETIAALSDDALYELSQVSGNELKAVKKLVDLQGRYTPEQIAKLTGTPEFAKEFVSRLTK